jgi:co-chaperonin GroES (HSP10)
MLKKKRDLYPIDTAVVINLGKKKNKTEGGIIFTDSYADKNELMLTEGKIEVAGEGAFKELKAAGLSYPEVGDNVCFKRYSGILFDCEVTGTIYRVVQDIDIYAIDNGEEVEVE